LHIQHLLFKAPMLVEMALVVAMAWIVADWLQPVEQKVGEGAGVAVLQPSLVLPLPNVADLVAVPLFGALPVQVKQLPKARPAPKPVVQSPLQVTLLGTVVAGAGSAAVLKLGHSSAEKVFFIGDMIQSGAVLKEVEASAVIIDHNGTPERIMMAKGAALSQPGTPARSLPPVRKQRSMSRAQLNRQMQNLPQLLTQARAMPNMVNGRADGFVITNIVPGSLYQQAGLQNGDILKKVNGQKLSNAGQAMQLYRTLQQAAAIDLELMRAGQLLQLHYDVR